MQGVTAGYSPTGTLLWEAFSKLATVWAAAHPAVDVRETAYDALLLLGVGVNRYRTVDRELVDGTTRDVRSTYEPTRVCIVGWRAMARGGITATSRYRDGTPRA